MILTYQAANLAFTADFVESSKVLSAIEESGMVIVIDPPLDVAAALIVNSKGHGQDRNMGTCTSYQLWIFSSRTIHKRCRLFDSQSARG